MDPLAPPKPAPEFGLASRQRSEPSPLAAEADRRIAEHAAATRDAVLPAKLNVQLDEGAQRFVQTLTDVNTAEMLRRYPSEAQLAYSRAVMAYLRAHNAGS